MLDTTNGLQDDAAAAGVAPPEPIAIVGIGCRFPGGANDPDSYWRLLVEGTDAIGEVPPERWDWRAYYDADTKRPGKTYTKWGGFIDGVSRFDPTFFGISPREAAVMDPQQRLLLELAWEALEDGGQSADQFAGSRTGVFIGISAHDYGDIQSSATERKNIDAYMCLGSALSIAANRISYIFDLRGPSLALDTACSSALVAVHYACQSIWTGEATQALAGSAHLLFKPEMTIGFSKASMLSPDGRCKSFAAAGNGYVRSEGAGLVVLKPLADALADGDRIYALIRGTAVNQDGRTGGISVPSQDAQEAMLRDAYRRAGIAPHHVHYVEAHGTGTPVGDPIEARALGAVLGKGREPGDTCLIGSVKSNIGHLESASGMAGLIKAALALRRHEIPGNLHFDAPNADIDFAGLGLRVPRVLEDWPQNGHVRVAGVNSFGFGGTNAHVVLSGAPPQLPGGPSGPDGLQLVPLSARSPEALQALAAAWLAWLDGQPCPPSVQTVAYNAAVRRSHHEHRLSVTADCAAALRESLHAFLQGEKRPGLHQGRALSAAAPVFVFTGMGPQWWGMGRQLFAEEPVFRDTLRQVAALLDDLADWRLLDELLAEESASRIQEPQIAQPAIFAVQVALAALWQSWGVTPAAILGHSVGEVAAAHVAGALSLQDAVQVIYHRSRLQHRARGRGGMLAVGVSLDEAHRLIAAYADRVAVAAVNGPATVTLSGCTIGLQAVQDHLEKRGKFHRRLQVDVPYHGPQMDALRAELLDSLAPLRPDVPQRALYSTVSGKPVEAADLDATYWWRNVREPVAFAQAVTALLAEGHTTFVEVGPHPVLSASIRECAAAAGKEVEVVASLRRQEPERAAMLSALGQLYCRGAAVDWRRLHSAGGQPLQLPAYPWQRESFWRESEASQAQRRGRRAAADGLLGPRQHPLLGQPLRAAHAERAWHIDIDLEQDHGWLADHRIQGMTVFPGAGYVEMALAAGLGDNGAALDLCDVEFQRALILEADQPRSVQLLHEPGQDRFEIHSTDKQGQWTCHAVGAYRRQPAAGAVLDIEALRASCPREIPAEELYAGLAARGLNYGRCFQGIRRLWAGDGEALALIALPEPLHANAADHHLHPAVLDACFQTLLGAVTEKGPDATPMLPVRIEAVRMLPRPETNTGELWCHARLVEHRLGHLRGDLVLADSAGRPVAEVRGLLCQAVGGGGRRTLAQFLYEERWLTRPLHQDQAALGELPTAAALAEVLQPRLTAASPAALPALERLCALYAVEALEQLGQELRVGQSFTTRELVETGSVAPQRWQLLERLLEILRAEGVLARRADCWRVLGTLEPHDSSAACWRRCVAQAPAYHAELALVARFGPQLAAVLRGVVEVATLFHTLGTLPLLEHLHDSSPTFAFANQAVEAVVQEVVHSLPRERHLRVLDLAAAGGWAARLLPHLPAERTEYVLADAAADVLARAEQRYGSYPFVRCVNDDPQSTGSALAGATFDIILLAGPPREQHTLARLQALLAAGGLLVVHEFRREPHALTLTLGLLEEPHGAADWHDGLQARFEHCARLMDGVDEQALVLASAPRQTQDNGRATSDGQGAWLIFTDDGGVGEQLAMALKEVAGTPILVKHGAGFGRRHAGAYEVRPGSHDDLERLFGAVAVGAAPLRGVVYCWSLDAGTSTLEPGCHSALTLLQAADALPTRPRLWLVTGGSQAVTADDSIGVAQAPLWGLGRVVQNEQPAWRCTLFDLPGQPTAADIQLLCDELCADSVETEVAARAGRRHVHRLSAAPAPVEAGPRRLEPTPGASAGMALAGHERRVPGPGQVEIEVAAAGVNFKDIAKVVGLLGDASLAGTYSGRSLGLECAGTVCAVGAEVRGIRVGDAVVALAAGCLGTHALTDARFVVPKPASLSFAAAATLPVTFLTAYYALVRLAGLRRGERVLIHAAAGGVGLAAVQIARWLGAEVFATAGSPEKRAYLRDLGVPHVMDSRSLAFADDILEKTNSRGVDVVLNSLAGPALARSLAVLAPGGRFLEIGKRDLEMNTRLGLRPFQKQLAFFAIDLDRLWVDQPDLAGDLFREVMVHVATRALHPLPHRVFPLARAAEAFQHVQRARHIGKVVLTVPPVKDAASAAFQCRADGTYLITGGLGGFGLATAQWLAQRGVRHLALLGRRGVSAPATQEALDALRKAGVDVRVYPTDIARPEELQRTLAGIRATMPPLRGVFHAAMVIDDGALAGMTPERFRPVLAAKAGGAWNLHEQTRTDPLDCFVLYSSVAATVGNPGQASYVAANAFLDALAHERRRLGLPALAINWGAVADVGYVARHAAVGAQLDRNGLRGQPVQELLDALGELLARKSTQAVVADVDWQLWAERSPTQAAPRYSLLGLRAVGLTSLAGSDAGPREAILNAPAEQRGELLEAWLRDTVARTLATAPAKLDLERPLTALGLDSLMAVELGTAIKRHLNVEVPTLTFMRGPSVRTLAAEVLALLAPTADQPIEVAEAPPGPEQGVRLESSNGVHRPLDTPSLVFAVQEAGTAPPLFLAPDFTGNHEPFAKLAHLLGDQQPVLVLQTPVLDAAELRLQSMAQLAERMADAVSERHPSGPYVLGGWSVGGLIALEVARRLAARGGDVEQVLLLDSRPPRRAQLWEFLGSRMPRFLGPVLARIAEVERGVLNRAEAMQQLTDNAGFLKAQERLRAGGHLPRDFELGRLIYNLQVVTGYVPAPYAGRVVLCKAQELLAEDPDRHEPTFGWDACCPRLEVVETPGNHFTLLSDKHLPALAALLQHVLASEAATSSVGR